MLSGVKRTLDAGTQKSKLESHGRPPNKPVQLASAKSKSFLETEPVPPRTSVALRFPVATHDLLLVESLQAFLLPHRHLTLLTEFENCSRNRVSPILLYCTFFGFAEANISGRVYASQTTVSVLKKSGTAVKSSIATTKSSRFNVADTAP